jgi:DNA topoisomerase-1
VKKTMMIAQKLYEGVELGAKVPSVLITYMRTDSTRVSETALGEVRDSSISSTARIICRKKPFTIVRRKTRRTRTKRFVRPKSARTPDSLAQYLKPEELKLYRLIWQRFVASQMMPAVFDQTTIDIQAGRSSSARPVRCRSLTAS